MTPAPVLTLFIRWSSTRVRLRLDAPPDCLAPSFRVVADLAERMAVNLKAAVADHTDFADSRLSAGDGDPQWEFLFLQLPGDVADLRSGRCIRWNFRSSFPRTPATALQAFVLLLLAEPDVDAPCWPGVDFTLPAAGRRLP